MKCSLVDAALARAWRRRTRPRPGRPAAGPSRCRGTRRSSGCRPRRSARRPSHSRTRVVFTAAAVDAVVHQLAAAASGGSRRRPPGGRRRRCRTRRRRSRARSGRPARPGASGSCADLATAIAYGKFFWTSGAISASSSGNSKPLPQSSGSHASSGSTAEADSQVDISGVCGQRAERLVHVPVGLAVRRVELGAELRDVAGHRRRVDVADDRLVDQVVGARGQRLPADAVEQQLGGRVPVDRVLRPDPVEQPDLRLRLGLGAGRRAAVRLAREDVARSPRCRSPTCRGSCG